MTLLYQYKYRMANFISFYLTLLIFVPTVTSLNCFKELCRGPEVCKLEFKDSYIANSTCEEPHRQGHTVDSKCGFYFPTRGKCFCEDPACMTRLYSLTTTLGTSTPTTELTTFFSEKPTQPVCVDFDVRCNSSFYQQILCASKDLSSISLAISTCPKTCNRCDEYFAQLTTLSPQTVAVVTTKEMLTTPATTASPTTATTTKSPTTDTPTTTSSPTTSTLPTTATTLTMTTTPTTTPSPTTTTIPTTTPTPTTTTIPTTTPSPTTTTIPTTTPTPTTTTAPTTTTTPTTTTIPTITTTPTTTTSPTTTTMPTTTTSPTTRTAMAKTTLPTPASTKLSNTQVTTAQPSCSDQSPKCIDPIFISILCSNLDPINLEYAIATCPMSCNRCDEYNASLQDKSGTNLHNLSKGATTPIPLTTTTVAGTTTQLQCIDRETKCSDAFYQSILCKSTDKIQKEYALQTCPKACNLCDELLGSIGPAFGR